MIEKIGPTIYKGETIYNNGAGGSVDFSKYHYTINSGYIGKGWQLDNFIYSCPNGMDYPIWGSDINLAGKNITLYVRANIQQYYTANGAIIGCSSENNLNFKIISVHYRPNNKEIWCAVPNSTNTAWQSSGWVNCDIPNNTWFTLKYRLDQTNKNVKVYIDNTLYVDFDYSEDISFSSNKISFGCNYNFDYKMYEMIDSSKTYIVDNDTNEIIWGVNI